METTDLTTRVLIEIRDELRGTNARIDETNARIDRTNQHLERLEQRVTQIDLRLSTDIMSLAGAINDEVIHGNRDERDIDELKRRP